MLVAVAVAVGGLQVVAPPAGAVWMSMSYCGFEASYPYPRAKTSSVHCDKAQPRIVYRTAGGSIGYAAGTLKSGVSTSPSVSSPLTVVRVEARGYYDVPGFTETSGWMRFA
ncbi:hypothetical protein DLJ96_05725 [Actinotalea fermentans ATCC 43279 = JCM 9966 = DSM 3133]|nr:hypothetical protein DLJ96_05725 [Actinotalea fermentans ATCC 43279 = JCM 9966 = DSM 3133]